ncbi:hypothetical protein ScPMuIL_006075 [Solemya velum]
MSSSDETEPQRAKQRPHAFSLKRLLKLNRFEMTGTWCCVRALLVTRCTSSSRNILCRDSSSPYLSIYQRRYKHHFRRYASRMFQNMGKIQPATSDLSCKSHKLMLYNDILSPCHPGAFSLLPLGQRALEKLIQVIDEELEVTGAQKMSMPSLAPSTLWEETGRWVSAGAELFRIRDRHDLHYCLGPTHEEVITSMVAQLNPLSYKRLPILLYQITRKFRDEMAPKHGLLRGREFEMKDLYTFDATVEDAEKTYRSICEAYCRIFDRLGLPFNKVSGATGNIGGSLSHEFHLSAEVGEDKFLTCDKCGLGTNVELLDKQSAQSQCGRENCELVQSTGIEVGHAFLLGTKYSSVFNAIYQKDDGQPSLTEMGCYGLGVTRVLQAGIEVLSTEDRIRWPNLLAPYQVCIIPQKEGYMAEKFRDMADSLSDRLGELPNMRGEVVIDDRTHLTVGKRLYEAKRIGYPFVVIVGKKALETSPQLEVLDVYEDQTTFLSETQLCQKLSTVETVL